MQHATPRGASCHAPKTIMYRGDKFVMATRKRVKVKPMPIVCIYYIYAYIHAYSAYFAYIGLVNLTMDVRETGVSRHHGGQLKALVKPRNTIVL